MTTLRNNLCELRRKNEKLERLCKRRNEGLLAVHSHQQAHPQRGLLTTTMEQEDRGPGMVVCSKCCKDAINSSGLEIGRKTIGGAAITKATLEESCDQGEQEECTDDRGDWDNRSTAVKGREKRIGKSGDINLINAIKLELEVKQLRTRLAEVEQELREQRSRGTVATVATSTSCHGEGSPPAGRQQGGGEKCEVGVQIDGLPIRGQGKVKEDEEKESHVIEGKKSSEKRPMDAPQMAEAKTEGEDGRLMALVQEQLSKALEHWQQAKEESAAAKEVAHPPTHKTPLLTCRPVEIISIGGGCEGQESQSVTREEMKRILQQEVQCIETVADQVPSVGRCPEEEHP